MSGLRDAAYNVDPALKAEADAVFAAFIAPAPADAAVPVPALPAYQPAALAPLPATPEELVTALAASYTGGTVAPLEVEQIVAAVAILAHRDRAGLAEVFRPLYDRYGSQARTLYQSQFWIFPIALRCLLDAVLGEDHRADRLRFTDTTMALPRSASLVIRVQELTDLILRGKSVPTLLATPTEASGAIDPAVFEDRMAAYRELGIKPLPSDLDQAELRVAASPARAKALAEFPIGERTSTNEAMGKSLDLSRPALGEGRRPRFFRPAPRIKSILLLQDLAKDGVVDLPRPGHGASSAQLEFAPIMLPHDPGLVAASALTILYQQANGLSSRADPPNVFPALAETAGAPGPLTHMVLAYALAADNLEHRIAAQDAALILAARGLLRPELLGRLAAIAWQRDLLRGKRIVDSLVRLEESGASAEIFRTTATMLDPLWKTPEIRGLPEVLLLATRAAVSAGIRDVPDSQLPGLAELAALTTPKRIGVEARRLREAIATPA